MVGFRMSGMNATETAPKSINSRLKRIQFVSRIAMYLCLVVLAFSTVLVLLSVIPSRLYAPTANVYVWRILLRVMFQIILLLWYWKLSRLFQLYERGLIFAAETIRCIKTLGILWVAGWAFTSALNFIPKPPPIVMPLGSHPKTGMNYHMGFFTFDFGTGMDFGPLLAGAVIILIAWIMDEGRKIQEEQELTV